MRENNQFLIGYSFPGICSLCHKEIAAFEGSRQIRAGIFRPIIKRILGIARVVDLKLDDNSEMGIAMCKTCESGLKPEDMQELMESEINGWQHEEDEIANFTDTHRIKYMKRYSKRFVTDRVDEKWSKDEKLRIKKPRRAKLKVRIK